MSEQLSTEEICFNAGLQTAINYHETIANAADRHCGMQGDNLKPISLAAADVLIEHRRHANALRALIKITDGERRARDRAAEILDR